MPSTDFAEEFLDLAQAFRQLGASRPPANVYERVTDTSAWLSIARDAGNLVVEARAAGVLDLPALDELVKWLEGDDARGPPAPAYVRGVAARDLVMLFQIVIGFLPAPLDSLDGIRVGLPAVDPAFRYRPPVRVNPEYWKTAGRRASICDAEEVVRISVRACEALAVRVAGPASGPLDCQTSKTKSRRSGRGKKPKDYDDRQYKRALELRCRGLRWKEAAREVGAPDAWKKMANRHNQQESRKRPKQAGGS